MIDIKQDSAFIAWLYDSVRVLSYPEGKVSTCFITNLYNSNRWIEVYSFLRVYSTRL